MQTCGCYIIYVSIFSLVTNSFCLFKKHVTLHRVIHNAYCICICFLQALLFPELFSHRTLSVSLMLIPIGALFICDQSNNTVWCLIYQSVVDKTIIYSDHTWWCAIHYYYYLFKLIINGFKIIMICLFRCTKSTL